MQNRYAMFDLEKFVGQELFRTTVFDFEVFFSISIKY